MKRKFIIVLTAALSMMLVLAGCGKYTFSMNVSNDMKSASIELENAKAGDFVMSGALDIEEGDTVYIEPALEGDSEINIKLIGAVSGNASTEAESADEAPDPGSLGTEEISELIEGKDPVLDVNINGSGVTECTLPAGEYYISVTVEKKATGSVVIRTEKTGTGIANPWSDAASLEEAAKGAGLDSFEIPEGTDISLGTVSVGSCRCMDGLAEVEVPYPAVLMTVRKGTGTDDISGDYNTYKNEWTQDIDGIEVKCFGNREGESTKTIWTSGDCSYAILAYGAGGDDDYGLSADDLAALVSGIK